MIGVDAMNNIPDYIKSKVSLPIAPNIKCKKIISCKPKWGMVNKEEIQNIINSRNKKCQKLSKIEKQ